MLKFTTDCFLWMKAAVAAKPFCVLNAVRVLCIAYEYFSIKERAIYYFKSYISCFHVLPQQRIQGQQIMSAVSSELYTSLVATVSRCMHASHMHQKLISCGPRLQTRHTKKDVRLLFGSHWLENIKIVLHKTCDKKQENQESFQLQCESAPVFPSVYPGSLSVSSVGCVCLPVSACACHLSIIFSMSLSLPSLVSLSCLNPFLFLLCSLYLLLPLSSALNAVILSLQNLALLFTIPNGLTYITYFTVTL